MPVQQPRWTEARARILLTRLLPIYGIVLHDTAGTGTHNDTLYLQTSPEKGRNVSVDFTVERDGAIWKLNPDLDKYGCAHAGRNTRLVTPEGIIKNGDVTRHTIGIEICQAEKLDKWPKPKDAASLALWPYTAAQVESVANLCAWLASRYKLVSQQITTHRNIITDGSRTDPRAFPFDKENGFWHSYWKAKNMESNFVPVKV